MKPGYSQQFEVLLLLILACLSCSTAIAAQPATPKEGLTLGQGERLAIDLRRGMTSQEVERLLGKPQRTTVRTTGDFGPPGTSSDTLQWIYLVQSGSDRPYLASGICR